MEYQLFSCANVRETPQKEDISGLVGIQTQALVNTYHTTCFDVKQLQEVLGVGESNAYKLLRDGTIPYQKIGRRNVVPVAALAYFLVMGKKS